ncbi:MAG: transposase [Phycisphaeraceae bacterium]|nr:transposase [Phycisphaeraceae bacterium]
MTVERERTFDAAACERSGDRHGFANGLESGTLATRVGEVWLQVPSADGVPFYPGCMDKESRREKSLTIVSPECCECNRLECPARCQGVSNLSWRMKAIKVAVKVTRRHDRSGLTRRQPRRTGVCCAKRAIERLPVCKISRCPCIPLEAPVGHG